jgi:serine/threonine protein phosphatase PrpC
MDNKRKFNISYSIVSEQGIRVEMEDAHFLLPDFLGQKDCFFGAVFDGHGGSRTAEYAKSNLPVYYEKFLSESKDPITAYKKALERIDSEISDFNDGATVASFFLDDNRITLANIGDSRVAIIGRFGILYITPLHRVSDAEESKRVISSGAVIDEKYVYGKDGRGLMVTRALGSHGFREVGIISEPSITTMDLEEKHHFILAGTDGLWDNITPESILDILYGEEIFELALEEIFNKARSKDNFTGILLRIKSNGKESIEGSTFNKTR